jgi:restriction system protein
VPIPDYETIMLPLLKFAADSNEHSAKETIESLSYNFNLTNEENILLRKFQFFMIGHIGL